MKMLIKLLPLILSVITFNSYALHESGPFKVTKIRLDQAGFQVALSPAPTLCYGGSYHRMHVVVKNDHPNFDAMYTAFLSAYNTGNTLSNIWYDKRQTLVAETCADGAYALLAITMIELSQQNLELNK
ncbi:hypothetical protein HR060_11080 [Catenovulum sp. SM1970]|uniref:hypothetical protein n=1 Tax=Marinifaba aquimaris TaxID=2741323 RepID=UPI0015732EB7|nr:hypothetical protein [Marinifaba aquimaris]NTS77403.1 hypothetical protein [Marinifaba aquimaris]